MKEMKTLNGYEVVDAKAREEITEAKAEITEARAEITEARAEITEARAKIAELEANSGGGGGASPTWNTTYDASKPVYGLKFAECDIKDSNDEYCCHPDKNIIYRHSLHSPFTFDCNVLGFYSRKHIINPIIADFTLQSDGQIYSQWGDNPLTITGLLINTFDNNSISVSQGAFVINNGDEYGIPTVVEWLQ